MNYEIRELISKIPTLNVQRVVSWQTLADPVQERHAERIVKSEMAQQMSYHIINGDKNHPPMPIITFDDHLGKVYRQTTYFFTRDELLQLAEECYHKGFNRQKDLHLNFTNYNDK